MIKQTKVLYSNIILIKILESRVPLANIILIRKYEFAKYHLYTIGYCEDKKSV